LNISIINNDYNNKSKIQLSIFMDHKIGSFSFHHCVNLKQRLTYISNAVPSKIIYTRVLHDLIISSYIL